MKLLRLVVFDFDGTLVNSPVPETGRDVYKAKTGKDWPHKGWWSKPESLDMNIFDIDVIEDVIHEYKKASADPQNLVIMMTGRLPHLSKHVEAILKAKGLSFHGLHFNNGGETSASKIQAMEKILQKFPSIKFVHMFDDRLSHIPIFKAWGEKLKGIEFSITVVPSGNHSPFTGQKSD